MSDLTVVRVTDASKKFVIRRDKSLKERVIHARRPDHRANEFWALRDIDLDIKAGSTVGLVGHNGSGKSTLLKLIGGILRPTTGTVERRGRLAALLELGAGFHPDLTGRENVFLNASILGLTRKQTAGYFDAIVDFSGIERFIDTQVKFYSSGMYLRLAFAVAVHVDPDVLLVDEVLAVGDEPFQRKCMDRIHEFQADGRTIVFVSHSSGQVGELCDRVVVLDSGNMVFDGAPEAGLRVLREGYDESRREDTAQHHAAPAAAVTAVRLVDEHGTDVSELTSGDPLELVVGVRAAARLEDWRIGVSITTPLGQVVFGTNTTLSRVSLPTLEGDGEVRFRFPTMPLVAGQYYVTAAVESEDGVAIDWRENAAMFTVHSDAKSVGLVDLQPVIDALPTASL